MSLAEKWEEIEKREQFRWTPSLWNGIREAIQQAFYAGAEAALDCPDKRSHFEDISELRAEIDRFKGLK